MDGIEKQKAEDAAKWFLGLIFSAAIATFQNWRSKREQAKVFRAQVQEMHEVVTAKPALLPAATEGNPDPAAPADDLRTIVQRIQQQLTEHQSRTDERHSANIARFESIEHTQERMGGELGDIRQYLRENRGETRTMLKKILTKVSENQGAPKEADPK